ncbi:hypothetical protein T02_7207 [Trichinella nativa]|uniref:Uncharacterized protein n=1 Tax=Trichinella nativa TaxID=6335 RepID=A0A0V1LBR4_9BILA|nr:hypothetical protein T02_7207 [Trichinella nativa]
MKKEQERNFIIENIQFTSELYIFLSFQFKLSGNYTMPKYHVISIFRTAINVQPANYATGKILHKVQIAIAYFQNHCKTKTIDFCLSMLNDSSPSHKIEMVSFSLVQLL